MSYSRKTSTTSCNSEGSLACISSPSIYLRSHNVHDFKNMYIGIDTGVVRAETPPIEAPHPVCTAILDNW
jgi:hypothetical protein